jgi:hypothetical protein
MVIVLAGLLPGVHSVVLAVTLRNPLVNADVTFNRIVLLPCPLTIEVPAGGVHT